MGTYRVSSGTNTFYIVTGPAGRYLASGPAGYTFDEQGRYVAWTADLGDGEKPASFKGKRTKITFEELKASVTQAPPVQ
jgi:hypothetical protein